MFIMHGTLHTLTESTCNIQMVNKTSIFKIELFGNNAKGAELTAISFDV